jgi:hypothetical protein
VWFQLLKLTVLHPCTIRASIQALSSLGSKQPGLNEVRQERSCVLHVSTSSTWSGAIAIGKKSTKWRFTKAAAAPRGGACRIPMAAAQMGHACSNLLQRHVKLHAMVAARPARGLGQLYHIYGKAEGFCTIYAAKSFRAGSR